MPAALLQIRDYLVTPVRLQDNWPRVRTALSRSAGELLRRRSESGGDRALPADGRGTPEASSGEADASADSEGSEGRAGAAASDGAQGGGKSSVVRRLELQQGGSPRVRRTPSGRLAGSGAIAADARPLDDLFARVVPYMDGKTSVEV